MNNRHKTTEQRRKRPADKTKPKEYNDNSVNKTDGSEQLPERLQVFIPPEDLSLQLVLLLCSALHTAHSYCRIET